MHHMLQQLSKNSGYLHLSTATNSATLGELQLVLQSKTSTTRVGQGTVGRHRVVRNSVSI